MGTDDIAGYIKKERAKGFGDDAIKKVLQNAGFDERDIERAFSGCGENTRDGIVSENRLLQVKDISVVGKNMRFLLAGLGFLILVVAIISIASVLKDLRTDTEIKDDQKDGGRIRDTSENPLYAYNEAQKEKRQTNAQETQQGTILDPYNEIEEFIKRCTAESGDYDSSCLALAENDISRCGDLDSKEKKEECKNIFHLSDALVNKEADICSKIEDGDLRGLCTGGLGMADCGGLAPEEMIDACNAIRKGDENLCKKNIGCIAIIATIKAKRASDTSECIRIKDQKSRAVCEAYAGKDREKCSTYYPLCSDYSKKHAAAITRDIRFCEIMADEKLKEDCINKLGG